MLDNSISFNEVVPSTNPSSEQVPDDVYQVVLEDITSQEQESYNSKMGKTKEKEYETSLTFKWLMLEDPYKGKYLYSNFVPTFFYVSPKSGKNKLYKIVEALFGRMLTQGDIQGFSHEVMNSLVGKQCRVVVTNKVKGDKTFSNVTDYLPVKTEIKAEKSTDDILKEIKF